MINICHVEVGGSYGGSLRALAMYLRHSDSRRIIHDVLLYYPTPGAEQLMPLVRTMAALYQQPLQAPGMAPHPLRRLVRAGLDCSGTRDVAEWLVGCARPLLVRPTVSRLCGFFKNRNYDLIHVNNTFTYQLPTLLAAEQLGLRVAAHVRNPVRVTRFNRSMSRLAGCLIAQNRSLANDLTAWGASADIQCCYDGVEVPPVDGSVAAALRQSLVPPGGLLVGSAGRLEKQKGYEDLIETARQVLAVRPEARFVIAGDGPMRGRLEELIARYSLAGRFHLLGFRWDVSNVLAALDVFVCSSLWEGGPYTVAEAFLLGKPVVSTAVGFVPELIRSSITGEIVRPGDPNALAAALLKLLSRATEPAEVIGQRKQAAVALTDPVANARALDKIFLKAPGNLPVRVTCTPECESVESRLR